MNTTVATPDTEGTTPDTTGTPTPTPPTPAKTTRPRADQDQRIQNFITEIAQEIATAKQDLTLLTELAALAYDEAELTTGEDLALTSQSSFTLRQQAIGLLGAASTAVEDAAKTVDARNTDFRDVVRLAFTDSASRHALGVAGNTPRDKQKLITQLRASFATAAIAPYAAELTRRSYGPAKLAAALAELNALDTALSTRAAVSQQAVSATKARDDDYKALKAWAIGFRRAVKLAKARRK